MIGCLRTRVRKQPIIALYFESELVLKFYNLEACLPGQLVAVQFLVCVLLAPIHVLSGHTRVRVVVFVEQLQVDQEFQLDHCCATENKCHADLTKHIGHL